jgi:hypothetical protein
VANEPTYEVVAPTGRVVEDAVQINAHPESLSGTTVGFVWDHLFKGPAIFDAVRREIEAKFADVRFVDHDYFGDIHGPDAARVLEELPGKLRAVDVDVAVVAVGA